MGDFKPYNVFLKCKNGKIKAVYADKSICEDINIVACDSKDYELRPLYTDIMNLGIDEGNIKKVWPHE